MAKDKPFDFIEKMDLAPEVKATLIASFQAATKELVDDIASLSAEVETLKAELATATEAIEEVTAEFPTFKSKDASYELTVPRFIFDGTEYQAKDAVKSATLMAKIIKVGPGFLRKV